MRKKIVAGNWKMNKEAGEARALAGRLLKTGFNADNTAVVILPPFVYLSEFAQMEKNAGVSLGAQHCHHEREGAYTGEVSAYILKSLGIAYCLVGHSERRKYFHESDAGCLAKVKALLEQDITPILCVGEELGVRENGKHFDHVENQVLQVLLKLEPAEITRLVIAYEPVWAIGTGRTATAAQAGEMHSYIRQLITQKFDALIASKVHILYGGSVNAANARELMRVKDIDGVLVGGASLQAESFAQIIAAAE